jgi:hypothetical protein
MGPPALCQQYVPPLVHVVHDDLQEVEHLLSLPAEPQRPLHDGRGHSKGWQGSERNGAGVTGTCKHNERTRRGLCLVTPSQSQSQAHGDTRKHTQRKLHKLFYPTYPMYPPPPTLLHQRDTKNHHPPPPPAPLPPFIPKHSTHQQILVD